MIVKLKEQIEQPEVVHKYYESFDIQTMKDIDGKDVNVLVPAGSFSKNEIESRIKSRDSQMIQLQEQNTKDAEILSKIEAIKEKEVIKEEVVAEEVVAEEESISK